MGIGQDAPFRLLCLALFFVPFSLALTLFNYQNAYVSSETSAQGAAVCEAGYIAISNRLCLSRELWSDFYRCSYAMDPPEELFAAAAGRRLTPTLANVTPDEMLGSLPYAFGTCAAVGLLVYGVASCPHPKNEDPAKTIAGLAAGASGLALGLAAPSVNGGTLVLCVAALILGGYKSDKNRVASSTTKAIFQLDRRYGFFELWKAQLALTTVLAMWLTLCFYGVGVSALTLVAVRDDDSFLVAGGPEVDFKCNLAWDSDRTAHARYTILLCAFVLTRTVLRARAMMAYAVAAPLFRSNRRKLRAQKEREGDATLVQELTDDPAYGEDTVMADGGGPSAGFLLKFALLAVESDFISGCGIGFQFRLWR